MVALTSLLGLSNTHAQNYCEPAPFGFQFCSTTWSIDDITIGSYSEQNSGCNSFSYWSYNSNANISLTKGSPVSFSLASGGDLVQWSIWVDCNSDGDFTDASDFHWASTSPSSTVSGTIIIPSSATGSASRMRIMSSVQSLSISKADACIFPFNNETQDFNVLLNSPGGCSVPVNLAAVAGVTDAFLSWDSVGTQYNLEYGVAGFMQGAGTTLNPTTNTITLTGLTANTQYDFYVRNDCSAASGGSSSWNGPISFTTACTEISAFPALETFDSTSIWIPNVSWSTNDDTISNCWDRFPDGGFNYRWILREGPTTSLNTGPDSDYSGTGSYMHITDYGTTGAEATFTSPIYNTNSLTTPYLSFYYHMYGLQMGNLYVDVSANNGITWIQLDSIIGQQQATKSAAWLPRLVDVSNYKSASFLYRFRAKATQNNSNSQMAIDNVLLAEVPSCPIPSSFQISNITGTSVNLSWSGNANEYYIEVGPAGFSQGTGAIDTVTGLSHTVTNLSGDVWYDAYIMSGCANNGTSTWAGPYQFRTFITPPWFEDFDMNGFLPNNRWTKAEGLAGNPTTFTSPYSGWGEYGWLNVGYDGSIRTYISDYTTENDWFFTENFDLGTGNSWELYFDAAVTTAYATTPGSLEADDSLMVIVSTDGGLTWNRNNKIFTINQANNLTNNGQTFVASLSGYSGVVKFGFYLESSVVNTNALNLFIDNIGIRVPTACPAPTAVNASNISANSLTISWTSNSTNFYIEYGQKGFGQGTGTMITGVTSNSTSITGLMPVTEYDFYITSVCGTDTSAASKITVLTGCPAVFSTPYYSDFDILTAGNPPAGGGWENCWVTSNSTGYLYRWQAGNGASQWANTGPDADHTTGVAGEGVYMYTKASNSGIEATMVNGPFDLSQLATPMLSFWYHLFGANMGELHVDISSDNLNWNNDVYTLIGQQQSSGAAAWQRVKIALSQYANDSIYIRFRAIRGNGSEGDMAIDDVAIINATGCVSPTGLNAINLTTTSAQLVWGSYASNTSIEWGPTGFIQGSGQGIVVSNVGGSNYTLTGLSSATAYDFYVQDTCNPTVWIGPRTFYTACTGPYNGTYTVGGATGTFVSLENAFESLRNCGIGGSVILSLQGINDTLMYTLEANQIPGLNAQNTLTIQGNGNDSIYSYPTANYLLALKGASYISFRNISFFNKLGNLIFWLYNNTHNITIENCNLYSYDGSVINYSSAAIAATALPTSLSSYSQNAFNINVTGNIIYNGYASMTFNGESANHTHGLLIENNELVYPYNYGIRVNYMDSLFVRKNSLSGLGTASYGNGLSFSNVDVFQILENHVVANGTALSFNSANTNPLSSNSLVANNMLISLNSGDGLNMSNVNNTNIFHNSVSASSNAIAIYGYSGNGRDLDIRNNIFKSQTEEAFYNSAPDSNHTYNYNVYFSLTGNLIYDNGSYATLSAWQSSVSGQNANSIQGDPGFFSAKDLHIISTIPNNVGDNSIGIAVDFDGDSRPAIGSTTVDIGADEFTPKSNDIAVTAIYQPISGCGDSATAINVVIRNMGINPTTSVPVTVQVTGDVTATLSATYSGSISQLGFDTVTVGTINTYNGASSVLFKAYSSLTNDEDASNDTVSNGPLFFIPAEPAAEMPDTLCPDPNGTATLYAQGYNGVYYGWYANQTDTVPVAVGDSFSYPMSGQTDWYLGYMDELSDSLKSMNYLSVFGGSGGLMFDLTAKTNLVIDSLNLHSRTNAGNVSDLVIYYIPNESYTTHANNPSAWTLLDTISYTGAGANVGTKVVLPTTLNIPSGATYAIYLLFDCYWEDGNVNNQVVNTPFMRYEGGLGFWSGAFSQSSNDRIFDGVIYAHNEVCSSSRTLVSVPLSADTAIASFSTIVSQPNKVDVDATASQGDLIEWNFGDGNTATGAIATHIYTTGGNYTITCIVTDTVCSTVDTAYFNVQMTIGIDENALANAVEIYPNPGNGLFNLNFAADAEEATVTILDLVGNVIAIYPLHNVSSDVSNQLDLSHEPSGLYFIKIEVDGATAVKKITKL